MFLLEDSGGRGAVKSPTTNCVTCQLKSNTPCTLKNPNGPPVPFSPQTDHVVRHAGLVAPCFAPLISKPIPLLNLIPLLFLHVLPPLPFSLDSQLLPVTGDNRREFCMHTARRNTKTLRDTNTRTAASAMPFGVSSHVTLIAAHLRISANRQTNKQTRSLVRSGCPKRSDGQAKNKRRARFCRHRLFGCGAFASHLSAVVVYLDLSLVLRLPSQVLLSDRVGVKPIGIYRNVC